MKHFDKIKTYKEIKQITKTGEKIILKSAIVYKAKSSDVLLKTRVGFLLSKKFGKAVKRNKARRRIVSALNAICQINKLELVFIPKNFALSINFEDLKLEIQTLF